MKLAGANKMSDGSLYLVYSKACFLTIEVVLFRLNEFVCIVTRGYSNSITVTMPQVPEYDVSRITFVQLFRDSITCQIFVIR